MAGRKEGARKPPKGWAGTGEPPTMAGYKAPYTHDVAAWMVAAYDWIATMRDVRRRHTAFLVLAHMAAHISRNDSLEGGEPMISASAAQLAEDTGLKRDTVKSTLDRLTAEGGPLAVAWKPSKGQRVATCYRLQTAEGIAPSPAAPTREGATCPQSSVDSGHDEEGATCPETLGDSGHVTCPETLGVCGHVHMPNNSPHMPNNSPHMPNNSPHMPNSAEKDNGHVNDVSCPETLGVCGHAKSHHMPNNAEKDNGHFITNTNTRGACVGARSAAPDARTPLASETVPDQTAEGCDVARTPEGAHAAPATATAAAIAGPTSPEDVADHARRMADEEAERARRRERLAPFAGLDSRELEALASDGELFAAFCDVADRYADADTRFLWQQAHAKKANDTSTRAFDAALAAWRAEGEEEARKGAKLAATANYT